MRAPNPPTASLRLPRHADARPVQLSTGLTAFLVSVPAAEVYSHKFKASNAKASHSEVAQIQ